MTVSLTSVYFPPRCNKYQIPYSGLAYLSPSLSTDSLAKPAFQPGWSPTSQLCFPELKPSEARTVGDFMFLSGLSVSCCFVFPHLTPVRISDRRSQWQDQSVPFPSSPPRLWRTGCSGVWPHLSALLRPAVDLTVRPGLWLWAEQVYNCWEMACCVSAGLLQQQRYCHCW